RFIIEFSKNSQGGIEEYEALNIFSTGQWLSIPFIIVGGLLLYRIKKRKELN
ncbi:MAG: prolipoprotein diacylglyceryl transferase, partial [Flavobacteriales bacterium]|nr:prolipoprotein diacylglyceryl transferase [Flavobacteriales bacterium]